MTREEAVKGLRFELVAGWQQTRDQGYVTALAVVDAGWTSVGVPGRGQYVAFSCSCPEPAPDRR